MREKLSDRIRALAIAKYVNPAILSGREGFAIRVKDLSNDLQAEGFPPRHTPQICSALQTAKFLRENGLEIERIDGPPSGQSPTVVVHYRLGKAERPAGTQSRTSSEEDPHTRALRLTEKLRGILKEELAEYGGGEAFLRWIRSEDDEAA